MCAVASCCVVVSPFSDYPCAPLSPSSVRLSFKQAAGCRYGAHRVSVVFLCPSRCVAVLCLPWCRGLLWCLPRDMRPPLLCAPCFARVVYLVVLLPSLRSYRLLFAPFGTLCLPVQWLHFTAYKSRFHLPFPLLRAHFSLPRLCSCVWLCFFPCLNAQSLCPLSSPTFVDMAMQGYRGCCWGTAGMRNNWCAARLPGPAIGFDTMAWRALVFFMLAVVSPPFF